MRRWMARASALGAAALFAASDVQAHGLHQPVAVAPPVKAAGKAAPAGARRWLAGDHHIHSRFSADYPEPPPGQAPKPVLGEDGLYGIPKNAEMARAHGLSWMVSTDHGGPNHSKLNYEQAYPELMQARDRVPEVLQFYGMELDTPGGDHSSLILPRTDQERERLLELEGRFSAHEPWPRDPARETESKMIEALGHMRGLPDPPVVIANHPSRSATGPGVWGRYSPAELRTWHDTAPEVAIGMEGAPGHQAGALRPDGALNPDGIRGAYKASPTLGGFDQMTARLGGFWDSMLGEGRRWWVTSTSDSHRHYREGGDDFWPGEYSKTYVRAARSYDDILDGLRAGRVFVTTGDLISELDVTACAPRTGRCAEIGGALDVLRGETVEVTIRVRDPAGRNFGGRSPEVARVDLILGEVSGPVADRTRDVNPTTRVVKRFGPTDWRREGEVLTMTYRIAGLQGPAYLRVRGTSTAELEPSADPPGEDPWADLWFYANPVFLNLGS